MKPSIQYQVSNIVIPQDILFEPRVFFNSVIMTNTVSEYLAWRWNGIKDTIIEQGLDYQDTYKEITPESIKSQVFFLPRNVLAVLIEFPDYEVIDATSKYGLIVSSSYMPMTYFTLEYGQEIFTKTPIFYTGRWVLNEPQQIKDTKYWGTSTQGKIQHVNYGMTSSKDDFINLVFDILQEENPNYDLSGLAKQICHPETLNSN